MVNSLFLTVPILSWLLCAVCVHSQVNNSTGHTCLNPGSIVNGYGNRSSRIWRRYRPGEKLTYMCYLGYRMKGQRHITCLDSGEWDHYPPTCYKSDNPTHRLSCENPKPIGSGWNNISYCCSSEFGVTLTYECIPEHRLRGYKHITCLDSGEWDHNPPECYKRTYNAGLLGLYVGSGFYFLFLVVLFVTNGWYQRRKKRLENEREERKRRERVREREERELDERVREREERELDERVREREDRELDERVREREERELDERELVLLKERVLLNVRSGDLPVAPAEPRAWTTAASQFVGSQSQEQSESPVIQSSSPGGTEISVEQSPSSGEKPLDLPTYTQAVRVKPARPALSQPEDSRSLPSYTQAIRSPTTRVPLDLMENAMEMRQWNTPTGLPTYTQAVRAEAIRPAVQSLPWDTQSTRIEISIDYDNFAPRNITSHQFEKDD